tara:strand:+ start:110 stop:295 length:186 start_codon:yes stop_codon:yes gene_type:complete
MKRKKPPPVPPIQDGSKTHKYIIACHDRIRAMMELVDPAFETTGDCLVQADKLINEHHEDR